MTKKLKTASVLLLISSIVLLSCQQKQKADRNLYDYKTKYVGDNSKVAAIAGSMDYPEGLKYASIEIKPDSFGLWVKIDESNTVKKEALFKNAVMTFALIDNLSELKYINVSTDKSIADFCRDSVNNILQTTHQTSCEKIGKSKTNFAKFVSEN